jgi:glycosyltransferase involved in cell wall biosynthesis
MHNLPPGRRATIVPGKTYEYMAAGKPILATFPDGDARDYLEKAGTAYLCRPNDINGMREILKRAYRGFKDEKMEKAPNREFISQFERRSLTQKLAGVFNRVLGK